MWKGLKMLCDEIQKILNHEPTLNSIKKFLANLTPKEVLYMVAASNSAIKMMPKEPSSEITPEDIKTFKDIETKIETLDKEIS